MTYIIALSKNDIYFHNRLKVLKHTSVVLAKAAFNDVQVLETRIIGHDDDVDELY